MQNVRLHALLGFQQIIYSSWKLKNLRLQNLLLFVINITFFVEIKFSFLMKYRIVKGAELDTIESSIK